MLSSNATLEKSDLIRPLSFEALEYFASGLIPVSDRDTNTLRCKFIRLGEIIMVGTTIRFGGIDWITGEPNLIKHVDLVNELNRSKELYVPALALLKTEPQLEGDTLHDAGKAVIMADETTPIELGIIGASFDFGRADETGRQRTLKIAQQLVGSNIRVFAL
jgi:hypothetical protein